MICPICESRKTRVSNVRVKENKTYRRRICQECGEKFTTYEVDTGMLMEIFEERFPFEITSKIAEILEEEFPVRSYQNYP